MDLDGDGQRDLITGSWPGEIYLFKGGATGGYAEKTILLDKAGAKIHTGKASVVHACDWDRDGDLDLILGCIDGFVFFVPNESGSKALEFGVATKVQGGGKAIRTHHSAAVVADWDGDGTLDLIVGQGDGGVAFYKNSARKGAPQLAAAELIVKSSAGAPNANDGGCGRRVKPHVTDWNGDGSLDLLLGDFSVGKPEELDLTDEQKATLAQLKKERGELAAKMRPLSQALMKRVLASVGVTVEGTADAGRAIQAMSEEERKAYWEAWRKASDADESYQALMKKTRATSQKMRPLTARPPIQGNVWVYLREAPAATSGAAN